MNLIQSIRNLDFERQMASLHRVARVGRFTRTDFDKRQLARLTKNARRFLTHRTCWGCDMPLDRAGCGAYGGAPPCSWQSRWKRRRKCLKLYRPRPRRAA